MTEMTGTVPIKVSFITTEDGDDLLVSFALGPAEQTSLTLLRTPKYESLLPEEERGQSLGTSSTGYAERELLRELDGDGDRVRLLSSRQRYELDLAAVGPDEIGEAQQLLRRMNVDQCFRWNQR